MRLRKIALVALLAALVVGAPAVAGEEEDAAREFRKRVDTAITDGCDWLAAMQEDDGTWRSTYDGKWPGGATALCVLALVLSEYNIWSDEVQKGLKYLLATNFDRTYSAAIAMMAVEARHIPPDEFKAMREGTPIKKFVRKLTKPEKQWMQRHVDMLLAGRQHEAWGYPKGPDGAGDWGGDLSNTQYALLGLKSASRCGIKVDEKDWMRVLRIVLGAQERKGPRVKLIVSRTEGGRHASVETRTVEARGWRYRWPYTIGAGGRTQTVKPPPDDVPSGSMTTAGISCLAILHSELMRSRRYRSKMKDVARAIDGGFAWLQENFAVDKNPGGNPGWHYYYLYGLERAAVLADRKWIGEHDWYRVGAEYLLDRQSGRGSWGTDILNTSFALLFLKRSTTPVALTGLHR